METLKTFLVGNRVKSFLWRTGMMIVAVIATSLLANIDMLEGLLNPTFIAIFGLVLGEVSKAINNYLKATN